MTTKTWQRTRLQNLIRHKSGRYYARAFAGGKEVWKSLRTSYFSIAEAKLAEFLKEHRERISNNGNGEISGQLLHANPVTLNEAVAYGAAVAWDAAMACGAAVALK